MTRLFAIATVARLAATVLAAAPSTQGPDFWYVVPGDASMATADAPVRGIVVPTSVTPTVQTSRGGSVISWRRPDGTRQSFVVRGIDAVTFEPGPLRGTIYVPFGTPRRPQVIRPDESCCSCATWLNSVESVEHLSCVAGCMGCYCEGCVCSPTLPCPVSPSTGTTLVANGGRWPVMSFVQSGEEHAVTVAGDNGRAVRFWGRHVSAEILASGDPWITNPDAIELPGRVVSRSAVRGEKALFAWVSPDASVILEQPRSLPAPSLRAGTIEFDREPIAATEAIAKQLAVDPTMDRCRACGTHPNSEADLDLFECVPGFSVCYRCVSWEC